MTAIDALVKTIIDKRSEILEDFARAYVAETGLLPSEIELCEQRQPDKIVYWFRRKEAIITPEWEPHV